MAEIAKRAPLAAMIRAAGNGELPRGWLCLADSETSPQTDCILVVSAEDDDLEEVAPKLGYPRLSLDTDTIEDIFHGAARLVENPSDDQLLRSFQYYCDHDAFISDIDAPVPPPLTKEQIADHYRHLDRQFYDALGPERELLRCRSVGCTRGSVSLSAFCRPHHFESVKGRPSPFDD